MILTSFDLWSTHGWPRVFWSIWPEMAFWVQQYPNRLRHVNPNVSAAPWKKVKIFGIFGVWHINWGRTKIWYLHRIKLCWSRKIWSQFLIIILIVFYMWPHEVLLLMKENISYLWATSKDMWVHLNLGLKMAT